MDLSKRRKLLLDAVRTGDQAEVSRLIRTGEVDVSVIDSQGGYGAAMHEASWPGHKGVMEVLIQAGANVNIVDQRDRTPIYMASSAGHVKLVQLLIKAKANLNCKSAAGKTAIFEAAQNGHENVVAILRAAGADCNMKAHSGRAPIHVALRCGSTPALQQLIHAANINQQDDEGCTPVFLAARHGSVEAVKLLIDAGADCRVVPREGTSLLYEAAAMGRERMVIWLLDRPEYGHTNPGAALLSPAALACCFGHSDTLAVLLKHWLQSGRGTDSLGLPMDDAEVSGMVEEIRLHWSDDFAFRNSLVGRNIACGDLTSGQLHEALNQSGFTRPRASFQSALTDVLEAIQKARIDEPNGSAESRVDDTQVARNFVVGSLSEGWGNSLERLVGKIDVSSDIDVTAIQEGRILHPDNLCKCVAGADDGDSSTIEYKEGYVICTGFASSPAFSEIGSPLRPACDWVFSYHICRYPYIDLLDNPERQTNIPNEVLDSLRAVKSDPALPCHAVAASTPDKDGRQLRVSTTFLEREFMRRLTTEQGQVFILLKYIVKVELPQLVDGMKTYHAKTAMFFLLDTEPRESWEPPVDLVGLLTMTLQRMRQSLVECSDEQHKFMPHFFLRDSWIFLRRGHSKKRDVVAALDQVMATLNQRLGRFMASLKPVKSLKSSLDAPFYFHPFVLLPDLDTVDVSEPPCSLQYHEICDVLKAAVLELSQDTEPVGDQSMRAIKERLARLPDVCASTAKQTMIAVAHLKFGDRSTAMEIVRNTLLNSRASREILPPASTDQYVKAIWEHLNNTDSAWRFCFDFAVRPNLSFLPGPAREMFPSELQYDYQHYVNFLALLRCLSFELGIVQSTGEEASDWFREALEFEDADLQEILMTLQYCENAELLAELIHKHKRIICDNDQTRRVAERRLVEDINLQRRCMIRTLKAALDKLKS